MKSRSRKLFHGVIAIAGLAFVSSYSSAFAQQAQSQEMTTTTTTNQETAKLPPQELDHWSRRLLCTRIRSWRRFSQLLLIHLK